MRVPVKRVSRVAKHEENPLQDALLAAGFKVQPFDGDLLLPEHKLVIGVESGKRTDHKVIMAEMKREKELATKGLRQMRFSEADVRTDVDAIVYRVRRESRR